MLTSAQTHLQIEVRFYFKVEYTCLFSVNHKVGLQQQFQVSLNEIVFAQITFWS